MLGGRCLSPCSQHWHASSGIACVLAAGSQIAVGTAGGSLLLFGEHELGLPVSELHGSGCSTAAYSPDGGMLLLGGAPLLQRVQLTAGQPPSPEPLILDGVKEGTPVACIACQDRAAVFAVAIGRWAWPLLH